ncbi:TonB family protein [Qingshengfaniella alkalisoli]|uniref:TonB family protein n=1 Tax=Qingshengfaniella alkalisoli TaxID=2599296 RepID=A0A5B8J158_9RHOB|nr:TonB family protein [Qingshengfaniella alkalisoli]QDY68237.1 TonB family protein [Qingshengfaniella alkalisoli]
MILRSPASAVLAAVASVGVHMAIFGWQPSQGPEVQISGGGAEVALLGNSFADMAAGTVSPVAPPTTSKTKTSAVSPVTQPVAKTAAPVSTTVSNQTVAAKPVRAGLAAQVQIPRQNASIEPQMMRPVAEDARVLESSPTPSRKPEPPQVARRRPAEQAAPQPSKPSGNASQSARKGAADGTKSAAAAASGPLKTARQSGNGANANYSGLVMRQIQRTRRERAGQRGTAVIGFSIGAEGQLLSVAVLRSSGSERVDRTALRHVQRSAPFPPNPSGQTTRHSVTVESPS